MSDKEKLKLSMKIGLFGLSDLRKLAPIGDLGYANGWYSPFGDGSWMRGGMERAIYNAYCEQYKKFGYKDTSYDSGYRRTDHHTYCEELGLKWSVDSSD